MDSIAKTLTAERTAFVVISSNLILKQGIAIIKLHNPVKQKTIKQQDSSRDHQHELYSKQEKSA